MLIFLVSQTFFKIFQAGYNDAVLDVAFDGYNFFYLAMSVASTWDSDNRIRIMKVDMDGNVLWSKSYDFGYAERMAKIVYCNNYLYVAAEMYVDTRRTHVFGVNPSDGSVIWSKYFEYSYHPGILCGTGGQIYVLGWRFSGSYEKPYVIVLASSNGSVSWQREYDAGNWAGGNPRWGDLSLPWILLAGGRGSASIGGPPSNYTAFALKLDNSGSVVWSKTYDCGSLNGDRFEGFFVTDELPVGVYLYGFSNCPTGTSANNAYIVRVDDNGNQYPYCGSNYNFISVDGGGDEWLSDGTWDGGGTFYFVGSTNSWGAGGYDVLVLTFDIVPCGGGSSWLDLFWSSTYGTSANEYGAKIFRIGSYLFVFGITNYYGNWDPFMLKINELDGSSCAKTSSTPGINVYRLNFFPSSVSTSSSVLSYESTISSASSNIVYSPQINCPTPTKSNECIKIDTTKDFYIYSIIGNKVYSGKRVPKLKKGVYILKQQNRFKKIIVK